MIRHFLIELGRPSPQLFLALTDWMVVTRREGPPTSRALCISAQAASIASVLAAPEHPPATASGRTVPPSFALTPPSSDRRVVRGGATSLGPRLAETW
jgi:hypothetical protein